MTQAAKGKAEVTKTTSGRRSIKLLGPALEALKAQKAFTYLANQEVFQNPRTESAGPVTARFERRSGCMR